MFLAGHCSTSTKSSTEWLGICQSPPQWHYIFNLKLCLPRLHPGWEVNPKNDQQHGLWLLFHLPPRWKCLPNFRNKQLFPFQTKWRQEGGYQKYPFQHLPWTCEGTNGRRKPSRKHRNQPKSQWISVFLNLLSLEEGTRSARLSPIIHRVQNNQWFDKLVEEIIPSSHQLFFPILERMKNHANPSFRKWHPPHQR